MGSDGFPLYRRRASPPITISVRGQDVVLEDPNKWVVPYNPALSKKYNAHINVEYAQSLKTIKYICKYIHKGHDRAEVRVRASWCRGACRAGMHGVAN
jgi:hypothetical protein